MMKKIKAHVCMGLLDFLYRYHFISEKAICRAAIMRVDTIYNNEGKIGVVKAISGIMLLGGVRRYRVIKLALCTYMRMHLETL